MHIEHRFLRTVIHLKYSSSQCKPKVYLRRISPRYPHQYIAPALAFSIATRPSRPTFCKALSVEVGVWRLQRAHLRTHQRICPFSTRSGSLAKDHDDSKPSQAANLVETLLAETSSATQQAVLRSEDTEPIPYRAQFEPKFKKYDRLSPSARWRAKDYRGAARRYDAGRESRAESYKPSPGWSQEITFDQRHRKLLDSPIREVHKAAVALDYRSEDKMRSYVQVLTTPTADTPGTTLLLHFDNKRYLIGSLAEGTQRACVQMGAGLLKVSECFLTGRTEWSNTGGLLGMILTLADASATSQASGLEQALIKAKSKAKRLGVLDDPVQVQALEDETRGEIKSNILTLFGPPNLNHTLATARRFIFRKGMPINVHEIRDDVKKKDETNGSAPYWADDNIKVWAMSVLPSDNQMRPADRAAGTVSPRKRSIDEVNETATSTNTAESARNGELTSAEREQLTVKAVVAEMFDSTWRLDTLYETPLSKVNLPATIFIRNASTNKVEKYHGPLPNGPNSLPDPDLKVLVRRPWPGALVDSLPHTEPAREAVSYIIRNHMQRGKFNPKRAIELKVEKGRKWSELSAGNNVVNEDGDAITPDMVLGESKQGGGLAVVDLPDASYIDNLIARPEWRQSEIMAGIGAIVWICGKGVANDSRLRGFMAEFSQLQHIVSSAECCPNHVAMDSSAAATVRLQRIDPARWRIPVHNDSSTDEASELLQGYNIRAARRGQVVQLEPSFEVHEKQAVAPLSISDVEREMSQDVLEEAAQAAALIQTSKEQALASKLSIPNEDAEITTLGTGSALPSKYRNVSATLVRVPGWGNILLDCGENTLGQLKRVFTSEELKDILQQLRMIIISHMHADHHLGTVGVIKAWYQEVHAGRPAPVPSPDASPSDLLRRKNRLAVVSEPAMQHWLMEYAAIEDYGFSHLAPLHISAAKPWDRVPSRLSWYVSPTTLASLSPAERTAKNAEQTVLPSMLDLADIQAVSVQHCHGARAVSISLPSGFKVSYSGDCRPSKTFAQIGRGSTVCIHEATFDDELQSDAEAKNHSTTSEALGIAQAMGARCCVLTHFSQRYQKIPVLERAGISNGHDSSAGTAQDLAMNDADEEGSANPEDDMAGPLEDAAATLPDQTMSNGAGEGHQYDLPSKRNRQDSTGSTPAAVKLKVASDMKVAVAFDYMRVKVGEIWQMEHFTPALLKLFAEEDGKGNGAVSTSAEVKNGKKGKRKGV